MDTALAVRRELSPVDEVRRLTAEINAAATEFYNVVGPKLRRIKNEELYKRLGYSSWSDYANTELAFSRQHADRCIDASIVYPHVKKVAPAGCKELLERELRPLAKIQDEPATIEAVMARAFKADATKPLYNRVRAEVDALTADARNAKAAETRAKTKAEQEAWQKKWKAECEAEERAKAAKPKPARPFDTGIDVDEMITNNRDSAKTKLSLLQSAYERFPAATWNAVIANHEDDIRSITADYAALLELLKVR